MRITHMFAAIGLTVATLATAAPAEAHRRDHDRWDRHDRGRDGWGRHWDRHDRRWDRRWDRHDRHHWRDDRRHGPRYGYRYGNRCWSEWRYDQRVRVCR